MNEQVTNHYDKLVDEGFDFVHDSPRLKEYLNKWDGQLFIDNLKLTGVEDVLEIGAGTGRLAIKVCGNCKTFTGIDISPKTIGKASHNLSGFNNIDLINDDFMTYNFNRKFDIIYSLLTFMHIKEKSAAINKIAYLLNLNGRFILSIDNNQSIVIDYGTRKINIYPDNPETISKHIEISGLEIKDRLSTELATIFVCIKKP